MNDILAWVVAGEILTRFTEMLLSTMMLFNYPILGDAWDSAEQGAEQRSGLDDLQRSFQHAWF